MENGKFGAPVRFIPTAIDYARVNAWKGEIISTCGLTFGKDQQFDIVQAYQQVVNGIKYYYELYPRGYIILKPIFCTILQSFNHGIPAQVGCGWGGFQGPDINAQNKALVGAPVERPVDQEDIDRVAAWRKVIVEKCGVPFKDTPLEVVAVYEQIVQGIKWYYKLYPQGVTGAKMIHCTIYLPVPYLGTALDVTCGWEGFDPK